MKTVCEPAANNLRPATSSRASPKGFHLLSWPSSNASGSGMHTPASFRARTNARGLLAGPYGQGVNLRARVKHWHLEGRMPEGFSPDNASPLQLPQTRFQIRPHARGGTIEDENSDWARSGRCGSVEPRRLFMGHRTADAVTTNLFSDQTECQRASRRSIRAGSEPESRVKHWHLEGRMPEGFSPANASPLQLPQTRSRVRMSRA